MMSDNRDKSASDNGCQEVIQMRCVCTATQIGYICVPMANQQEMREEFGIVKPREVEKYRNEKTETLAPEEAKSLPPPTVEDPTEPKSVAERLPKEELTKPQVTKLPVPQEPLEPMPIPKIRTKRSSNDASSPCISKRKKKKKPRHSSSSTSVSSCCCCCCCPSRVGMKQQQAPPWWVYNLEPPVFVCQPPVVLRNGVMVETTTGTSCTPFYAAATPMPFCLEKPEFADRPPLRSIFPPCGPCDPCVPTGLHQYFLPKR